MQAVWHDLQQAGYTDDLAPIAARAHGRVLELGAGTGRIALYLAEQGLDVTALDIDDELLAELRARASARGLHVKTIAADCFEIPTSTKPFDTIICCGAFHEIIGPRHVQQDLYEYLASWLKPGGVILLDPCDLDGLAFPSAWVRDGKRRLRLEVIADHDDGRSVFHWKKQVRRFGLWRTEGYLTQTLWPSDIEADASPSGLRIVEKVHEEGDGWADFILYTLAKEE